MPNRNLSWRRVRDLLPVGGVMALVLVLGVIAAGLTAPEGTGVSTAEGRTSPRFRIGSLAAADFWPIDGTCAHPSAQSHRQPTHLHAQREGPATPTSLYGDPREYLVHMATLMRRRRLATPTNLDPYQASLNPAVYLAGDATPTDRDGTAAGVPRNQPCRFR